MTGDLYPLYQEIIGGDQETANGNGRGGQRRGGRRFWGIVGEGGGHNYYAIDFTSEHGGLSVIPVRSTGLRHVARPFLARLARFGGF
jgi:hypothetical protein